jgi:DNA-binding beta-propeller fold protein YncE
MKKITKLNKKQASSQVKPRIFSFVAIALHLLLQNGPLSAQKTVSTLQVPGHDETAKINHAGPSVLPSGRYVTPAGQTVAVSNGAFGLARSPDEKTALILHHNGAISVVDLQGDSPQVQRLPAYGEDSKRAAFLGVAFAPDGQKAYLSGGDAGNVAIFDVKKRAITGYFTLDTVFQGKKFKDSFTSDLCFNPSKNELLVLDRGNNRLVRLDLQTGLSTASIPVGRIPFGVSLSPDGSRALVANVGLYQYPLVPGVTPTNLDSMMLQFPVFGLPSEEAEEGVTLPDGRFIPGLGSALAEEAMSVWVVDLQQNRVVSKLKTGLQIGEKIEEVEIVGGASPNSVAVGSRYAYVSNATNDRITVIDWKKGVIKRDIVLKINPLINKYRGMMPFGLCLSKDEKTLYVALLGLNAVAVVDVKKGKTLGYIPTGWGTTRVALNRANDQLLILSARGWGAGPNGGKGFVKPPMGTYVGDIQTGSLQRVPLGFLREKGQPQLKRYTQQVLDNTFREIQVADDGKNPCPAATGLRQSKIRHIVYITKENRTYDEVFGQLPNGNGDATLARFGENVDIFTKTDTLRGVNVARNHLKMARQWAISDNFYCDSDASIHGHHWMVGTLPNEYVEANSAAAGRFDPHSPAPGRVFPRSTGGIDPEDYNETGGLWENLARQGVEFYSFGECNEFNGNYEEKYDTAFGAAHPVAWAMPAVLRDRSCRDYAGYNTNIPDQFRVEQFERNFRRFWLSGKDTMPALVAIQLPNDHTSGPRPDDGYPYIHSYVADNDLALGRMLEFLSQTPYWKNMLVVVTEDDPQGGVDHVDAHRSLLMLAGPYVKRGGYVSHRHANFGSILKMIYHILDLPYVNQYDATATLLDDFFTENPDYTPYRAVSHDERVFQPQKAMRQYNRDFNWRTVKMGAKMDDPAEQRVEHYRQQGGGQ